MDANATSEVTSALGEWVSGLALGDVPRDVVEHLKTCFLDSLGCGLFGAAQPWGVIASNVAASMSRNSVGVKLALINPASS